MRRCGHGPTETPRTVATRTAHPHRPDWHARQRQNHLCRSALPPIGHHLVWTLLETQLSRNSDTTTDRTSLDASTRARLVYRGHQNGYAVHAVLLDTPYSVAVYRDSLRETPFVAAVLRRCYEKVTETRGRLLDEGFDRVTIITGS